MLTRPYGMARKSEGSNTCNSTPIFIAFPPNLDTGDWSVVMAKLRLTSLASVVAANKRYRASPTRALVAVDIPFLQGNVVERNSHSECSADGEANEAYLSEDAHFWRRV